MLHLFSLHLNILGHFLIQPTKLTLKQTTQSYSTWHGLVLLKIAINYLLTYVGTLGTLVFPTSLCRYIIYIGIPDLPM